MATHKALSHYQMHIILRSLGPSRAINIGVLGCRQLFRKPYISAGVINDVSVTVFGFPWCRDKPRTIGLNSAVANVLCTGHNSALSDLDNEAGRFSKFLIEAYLQPQGYHAITLNGWLLERWALKTFVNLGYVQKLHRGQPNMIEPPEWLVRYIFRNESIPDGIGLYHISDTVGPNNLYAGISWNSIQAVEKPNKVMGLSMIFYGVRFVVTVDPGRSENKIRKMGVANGFDFSKSQVAYRPKCITFFGSNAGEKCITLEW
jgi:hypothetical protein